MRPPARVPYERRYTAVGDFRIHSVHAGGGAPLVLVHGLSGSHRWWRFNAPSLAARFRVHIPELVGFGASRPAHRQPGMEELGEVLVAWLDALRIERAHLVGHSMGGQVAIHAAARRPERFASLVLTSASGIPRPLSPATLVRFVAEIIPPRAWGAPHFLPVIATDALRAGPRSLLGATLNLLRDDVRPLLPRVESRTLIVWGALDPLTPVEGARQLAAGIPRALLLVLPRASHNPMVDSPAAFNEAVAAFLAPA